jgi:hypothetical protein
MRVRRNFLLFTCTFLLFIFISPIAGVFWSLPAQAIYVDTPLGRVCHQDLDPTRVIPGSAEVAEQAWGEAGSAAYQASARIMRERNGSGRGLDETQKRFLRQRYGGLVDQVRVAYGSRMMSEWCALGKCVNLGGVDSAAQTYCDRIYAGDSYKPNDTDQLVLLAHEMRHSQQCRERGGEGSFGFHYFREYKRAGQNYANNSMEVDAVNTARDFTRNTICTQIGCTTSVEHYPNYNEWGIDLPVSLVTGANQSSTHNYDQLNARAAGCYYIRPLNNNFRNANFRWLDAKSDGTGVGLVSGQSHGTVWLLEETNQGSLLRSTNQNHRSRGSYRWLDGMSNGTGAQLVSDTSHGAFWRLEQVQSGYHIRSLNNNFRNNNFRWLDGASNGNVAQLVNGTSHGTLWELNSTSCP